MCPARIVPSSCLVSLIIGVVGLPEALAGRLSVRFAGGGSEVTLAYGETAVLETVFTMQTTDTTKSGARATGFNARFSVEGIGGLEAGGLTVQGVTILPGWSSSSSAAGSPFTEDGFFLGLDDDSGTGIAGNGTNFDTVVATVTVVNDALTAMPDAFVTFRHQNFTDMLPSVDQNGGMWAFAWQ